MNIDPLIDTAKKISDISSTAYEDTVQPSAKNTGKALGTVTDLVNTLLTPIEILNKTIALKKEKFLEDYEKHLNKIPIEKQCVPNFEISAPIIEHLKYKITEDTLREKYAKLLSEASNSDSLAKPLLSFDNVLNQLSPYEIGLLTHLFSKLLLQSYALASIKETTKMGYRYIYKNIPNISFRDLPADTISIMISNFDRLGIVKIDSILYIEPEECYDYITKSSFFLEIQQELQRQRQKTDLFYPDCSIEKGAFYLTEFGKSFVTTIIC